MDIKVYSTPTCPYCAMVKQYLSSLGKPYTSIDVSESRAALDEMVKVSGQMGVPVVLIDNQAVVGFDKEKIDQLLNK